MHPIFFVNWTYSYFCHTSWCIGCHNGSTQQPVDIDLGRMPAGWQHHSHDCVCHQVGQHNHLHQSNSALPLPKRISLLDNNDGGNRQFTVLSMSGNKIFIQNIVTSHTLVGPKMIDRRACWYLEGLSGIHTLCIYLALIWLPHMHAY